MIKAPSDPGNGQVSLTLKRPLQSSHQSEPPEIEALLWTHVLNSMSSISIAAYIMTSGVIQICFTALGISMCGVSFSQDDPCLDITWLVSTCWVMGLLRLLVSVCMGRPTYNRSVWSKPSTHPGFEEQLKALAFLPDLQPRNKDLSVLDSVQLSAGIIHPAFYFRTLMVAWQEGLLCGLWLVLHLIRLFKMPIYFDRERFDKILRRDEFIDELYASIGSNYTSNPLLVSLTLTPHKPNDAIEILRNPEMLNRIVSHTCELFVSYTAELFYLEDVALLIILGLKLLFFPVMSRIFKFICSR